MTIRHVVFWKLSATTDAERDVQVAAISDSLTALIGRVEGLHTLSVQPTLDTGQTWDLVLDAVFSDAAALAAYLVHPLHQAAGQKAIGMVVGRVAADYDDQLQLP
ncbi:MAG TPA: Dabb family protein [Blastococcus sp.]|nr:Dabb family protein [Blastococcus sp.]